MDTRPRRLLKGKFMSKVIASIAMVLCWHINCNAAERELTVSAAVSLANAFTELAEAFVKDRPGVSIHVNFAASNPLLRQILAGAPVDIFASADQETMDKAADSKAVDTATRHDFAVNDLVLIVPKDGKRPMRLAELEICGTIAIGDPDSVPAGRYARSALRESGQWEVAQSRLVPASSVRQALDYVARGEADCGFVYRTDALQAKDKVDLSFTVAKNAVYPVAVCQNTQNRELAQEFVKFVLSSRGQAILAKYGFEKPVR